MDTGTEHLIQEGLMEVMRGRTSIVIAKRLSTVRGADKIVIMDQGRITKVGTHEELLAEEGFYRRLFESQFADEDVVKAPEMGNREGGFLMSEYDLDLEEDVEERPFNKEHFARILSYARPYPKTVALATALTLTGIIIGLVRPLMFRAALDWGIHTGDWRVLGAILSGILGLRVLSLLVSRAQIKTTNYLGQKVIFDLRQGLFGHVEHLPFSFLTRRTGGQNHFEDNERCQPYRQPGGIGRDQRGKAKWCPWWASSS